MSDFFNTIVQPLISEKATQLAKEGQYVFLVPEKATKNEVKNALFHMYGVKVLSVNMSRLPSKMRLVRRGKTSAKRNSVKKAIAVFEGKKTVDLYKFKAPKVSKEKKTKAAQSKK